MCGLCPTGYEGTYDAQPGLEYARNNKQVGYKLANKDVRLTGAYYFTVIQISFRTLHPSSLLGFVANSYTRCKVASMAGRRRASNNCNPRAPVFYNSNFITSSLYFLGLP